MVKLKRVYDPPNPGDGQRILVDRLWPRGLSKIKAKIHFWLKDVAPTNELRTWFAHNVAKWSEFQRRYQEELQTKRDFLSQIKGLEREHGTITLVYAAKDETHNNAIALEEILRKNF